MKHPEHVAGLTVTAVLSASLGFVGMAAYYANTTPGDQYPGVAAPVGPNYACITPAIPKVPTSDRSYIRSVIDAALCDFSYAEANNIGLPQSSDRGKKVSAFLPLKSGGTVLLSISGTEAEQGSGNVAEPVAGSVTNVAAVWNQTGGGVSSVDFDKTGKHWAELTNFPTDGGKGQTTELAKQLDDGTWFEEVKRQDENQPAKVTFIESDPKIIDAGIRMMDGLTDDLFAAIGDALVSPPGLSVPPSTDSVIVGA